MENKPDYKRMMQEEICEDGLEHEPIDCPNCSYQFCSSCGEGNSPLNKKESSK